MAGCERICHEVASCVKKVRLALGEMLGKLRADDGLLTWKLEGMGPVPEYVRRSRVS